MSPNRNPRRQPPTDKKTPKEVPKWDDFRSKESREGFEARLNKYEERINEFNDRFDAVNIRVDVTIRSLQNKANLFPEGSRQRKFYEKWYKNVVDAKTEFYNKARFLDRISKKKFHELESREDLDLWRDVRGRHLQDFSIPGQNMWEETEHHVVMEQQRYVEDLNSIVDNFSKANKREVKYTGAFAFALKEITNREVREVRVHLELIKINKDDEELRKRLKQEVYEALDLINKEGSVLYTHRDASPVARARIEQLLSIRERMLDEAFSHFPEDRGLQFNLKGVRERNSNYLLSRAIEDDKYIAPLKEAKKEEQNSLEYIAEKYKTFTNEKLTSDVSEMVKIDLIDREITYLNENKIGDGRVVELLGKRGELIEIVKDIDIEGNVARLKTPEGSSYENIEEFKAKCYEVARFLRAHLKNADTSVLFQKYRKEYNKFKEWEQAHNFVLSNLVNSYGDLENKMNVRFVVAETDDTGYKALGDERVIIFSVKAQEGDHKTVIEKDYKKITGENSQK